MFFNGSSIYGVVGPNGIGKTTLFKCITGLTALSDGKIKINDIDVDTINRQSIVDNVSYLLSNGLINHISGWENAKLFGKLYQIADDNIIDLFKEFDLYRSKDKKVRKYSLGMKQRLALIISLINNKRKIIMLDEPYLGLDPLGIQALNEKLLKLKELGYLIIVSNHQLNESEKIFDYVLFLTKDGIISKTINEESKGLSVLFNEIYLKRGDNNEISS